MGTQRPTCAPGALATLACHARGGRLEEVHPEPAVEVGAFVGSIVNDQNTWTLMGSTKQQQKT